MSYLQNLPGFIGYLLASVLLLAAFATAYVRVTPYAELPLIREGNVAACLSLLIGGLLGVIVLVVVLIVATSQDPGGLVDVTDPTPTSGATGAQKNGGWLVLLLPTHSPPMTLPSFNLLAQSILKRHLSQRRLLEVRRPLRCRSQRRHPPVRS